MKIGKTKKLTTLALMTALSLVLSLLIRFPIVPAVPFLNFDPKDVVLLICGFIYGPIDALVVTCMTAFLEILFTGATWVDWIMNVISSACLVLPASVIYKKMHSKNGALAGMIAGILLNNISMAAWNYLVDPFFYHMPQSAVLALLPYISLFNLIKCSVNVSITLFIYKPVVTALRKSGLVEKSDVVSGRKSLLALGAFTAFTLVLIALACSGILYQ